MPQPFHSLTIHKWHKIEDCLCCWRCELCFCGVNVVSPITLLAAKGATKNLQVPVEVRPPYAVLFSSLLIAFMANPNQIIFLPSPPFRRSLAICLTPNPEPPQLFFNGKMRWLRHITCLARNIVGPNG